MLNIIIILLILLGDTVHRYLSYFWEEGILPYSFGFLFFANFFVLTYLLGFIWMFGIVAGVIVAVLCYLQVVYSAGLWVFSVPRLISVARNPRIPTANPLVYGGFSILVMIVAALAVLNFFVSPYKSMWEMVGEDVWTPVLVFAGVLVVGNVARVVIMSKMLKWPCARLSRN